MRVRLSHPHLIPDLEQQFERSGFRTKRLSEDTLCVRRADAPSKEQAEREIELHLAIWRATYPGVAAVVE